MSGKLPYGLTPAQLCFANALVEGQNPSDAYRRAYTNQRLAPASLRVNAQRVKNNPKVAAYVAECLEETRREVLLTRDKKRQVLGSIALDRKAPHNSRIAAIKVDNDMTGDSQQRFEGEVTLAIVFQALRGEKRVLPVDAEVNALREVEAIERGEGDDLPPQTAMEAAG